MFLSKHKNGIYYVIYQNITGKRNKISSRTKNKAEAKQFLKEFKSEQKIIRTREFIPISLEDFKWEYLLYAEAMLSWKTTLTYKTTFNKMVEHFGNPMLSELSTKQLEEFIQVIIKKSSHAARKHLINIKAAFNKAVRDGYLLTNPASTIKRIKPPEKLPVFYSDDEFKKLIKKCTTDDWKDIITFAVNTGMRQMEIITLRKRQINFTENHIILDNQYSLTKSRKIRILPYNETVSEILTRRLKKKDIEAVVFTRNGEPYSQDFLTHNFKKLRKKAGLNVKLNFHSLRHTFASRLVQRGVSIYHVSKLLGHADVSTTQIYAHLRTEDLRSAVERLE